MSEPIYTLTRAEIQEIAAEAAKQALASSAAPVRPELSVAEAMQLTGHRSESAFYRWATLRRVKSISQGRYRRSSLLRALGGAAA